MEFLKILRVMPKQSRGRRGNADVKRRRLPQRVRRGRGQDTNPGGEEEQTGPGGPQVRHGRTPVLLDDDILWSAGMKTSQKARVIQAAIDVLKEVGPNGPRAFYAIVMDALDPYGRNTSFAALTLGSDSWSCWPCRPEPPNLRIHHLPTPGTSLRRNSGKASGGTRSGVLGTR